MKRRALRGVLIGLPLAILVAALWLWTPLAQWVDAQRLAAAAAGLQQSPWALPVVITVFVLGTLLWVPVTALVTATALIFGPGSGILYTFAGTLTASLAGYALGTLVGRPSVERLAGSRFGEIGNRLRDHGIATVTTLRLVPIAHFTLINLAAGAWHLRLRDFLIGSLLGLAPGILALNLLGAQLRRLLTEPSASNLLWLLLLVLVCGLLLYGLRRRLLH